MNNGRFTLEAGTRVMHDFEAPIGWQLPPARESVSQMIASHDVDGLTTLIGREMGHYAPPGIWHRLEALMADGLVNDAEFEQILAHGDPRNLERMLERLEKNDREALRNKRIELTTFDEIQAKFPSEIAGLNFKIREDLEEMLNNGEIDPEKVQKMLEHGEVEELEDEVIYRERLLSQEHQHENAGIRTRG